MNPELMTPEEVAELLRLNRETVYRNLRSGKLPGTKVGKQWRISRLALEKQFGPSLHERSPLSDTAQERSA